MAIEEIISNNPFGVAFDSEDVTRFGTCELKSASDYADCDDDSSSSDFNGDGLYVKLASSLLSEGMGVETLHYGICPIQMRASVRRRIIHAHSKAPCGGNRRCSLPASYTDDR